MPLPDVYKTKKIISHLTKLGVVAAESNELLADGAAPVGLPLALLRVRHHPLHLVAAWQPAVGVSALAGVDQALDAPLDAQLPRLLGVVRWHGLAPAPVKPKLLHLMGVAIVLVAGHTQVEVLANGAVVSRLYGLGARVAVVHKLVLALSKISCRDLYKM